MVDDVDNLGVKDHALVAAVANGDLDQGIQVLDHEGGAVHVDVQVDYLQVLDRFLDLIK